MIFESKVKQQGSLEVLNEFIGLWTSPFSTSLQNR